MDWRSRFEGVFFKNSSKIYLPFYLLELGKQKRGDFHKIFYPLTYIQWESTFVKCFLKLF